VRGYVQCLKAVQAYEEKEKRARAKRAAARQATGADPSDLDLKKILLLGHSFAFRSRESKSPLEDRTAVSGCYEIVKKGVAGGDKKWRVQACMCLYDHQHQYAHEPVSVSDA
jgi:hypothetical protein